MSIEVIVEPIRSSSVLLIARDVPGEGEDADNQIPLNGDSTIK